MRQNGRTILLSALGVIAAIAVMAFVGSRMIGRFTDSDFRRRNVVNVSGGETVTLPAEFENFDSIVVIGGWSLTIVQGTEFGVEVTATEKAADEVEIFQRGSELTFSLASGIRTITGNLQATLVMPTLAKMRVDGGTTTTIKGFEGEELELQINGAASIRATDSTFTVLDIDVDGAATLNFYESSVVNAVLDMDGAAKLSVTMSGGELSGVLRGVGDVSYRGEVSRETVDIEGIGRVRRQ